MMHSAKPLLKACSLFVMKYSIQLKMQRAHPSGSGDGAILT